MVDQQTDTNSLPPARDNSQASCLLAVVALGLMFVLPVSFALRPAVPIWKLKQVETGMTKQQVRDVLGEPQDIGDGEWTYSEWGNPGWVEISFDRSGRVTHINDESAFQW